jgi:hypothetical protein
VAPAGVSSPAEAARRKDPCRDHQEDDEDDRLPDGQLDHWTSLSVPPSNIRAASATPRARDVALGHVV